MDSSREESRESLLRESAAGNNIQLGPISSDALIESRQSPTPIPRKPVNFTQPVKEQESLASRLRGQPLRIFWFRTLVAISVPVVVTTYYFLIWAYYLRASPSNSPIFLGPRGALWVFYSWFVVAVLGLNLSVYGLEGVEAGMMMDLMWSVGSATRVMMHGDHSWSGPGGWLKVAATVLRFRSKTSAVLWPSALWMVLASQSLLVFLALPISGLVMNLGSGFVTSRVSPLVKGFSHESFNVRNAGDAYIGASINWQYAISPRIPGMGLIYTKPGVNRADPDLSYLQHLPNSLPTGDVDEIFLTAQADAPVDGTSWGLALKYNCSVVADPSDFSILKYRNSSMKVAGSVGSFSYNTPGNDTIFIYNQTNLEILSTWASNLEAVVEFGVSRWPKWPWTPDYTVPYQTSCYNLPRPALTGDYPGIDSESVFEAILWQHLYDRGSLFTPHPTYNTTIDSNLTSLYGAYKTDSNMSMSAVGVRCISSSAVGTARIDAIHSAFSDFQRTDTPIFNQTERCGERFEPMALLSMFNSVFSAAKGGSTAWLSTLFSSVSAPPALYGQYDTGEADYATGMLTQLSMFQASDLRNSLLKAYAAYAVQLAYNGGQGYSNNDGAHSAAFTNPNVTAYEPSAVLQPGVVPPIVPGILLLIWALGSIILGCWYGFRHRWAETLDAYSLFVFGADLAEQMKNKDGISATVRFDNSQVLRRLPGLVGDAEVDRTMGRIGLVERRNVASKTKWYL